MPFTFQERIRRVEGEGGEGTVFEVFTDCVEDSGRSSNVEAELVVDRRRRLRGGGEMDIVMAKVAKLLADIRAAAVDWYLKHMSVKDTAILRCIPSGKMYEKQRLRACVCEQRSSIYLYPNIQARSQK